MGLLIAIALWVLFPWICFAVVMGFIAHLELRERRAARPPRVIFHPPAVVTPTPKPKPKPGYLRKWTLTRRMAVRRDLDQWQEDFDLLEWQVVARRAGGLQEVARPRR